MIQVYKNFMWTQQDDFSPFSHAVINPKTNQVILTALFYLDYYSFETMTLKNYHKSFDTLSEAAEYINKLYMYKEADVEVNLLEQKIHNLRHMSRGDLSRHIISCISSLSTSPRHS